MTETIHVTAPNAEQLESAWWRLMQGELGIEHDRDVRWFIQSLVDHMRHAGTHGQPILDVDGEPLAAVGGDEVAKRVCAAYACLFYGVPE